MKDYADVDLDDMADVISQAAVRRTTAKRLIAEASRLDARAEYLGQLASDQMELPLGGVR